MNVLMLLYHIPSSEQPSPEQQQGWRSKYGRTPLAPSVVTQEHTPGAQKKEKLPDEGLVRKPEGVIISTLNPKWLD